MLDGSQTAILRIVIDHRERSSQVASFLEQSGQVQLFFEQLKLGDYQTAEWLFERKTLTDFAASLVDGRLFSQAYRLADSNQPSAIILEGTSQDLAAIHVHRSALQGALISLSLIYQLPVLRSRGPEETAQLLLFAGRQLGRSRSDWAQRSGRRPKRLRKLQLYVLEGLPGIGPQRAAALLDHFGTVRAVITASEEDLCRIKGIHHLTAAKIEWVLGGHSPPEAAGQTTEGAAPLPAPHQRHPGCGLLQDGFPKPGRDLETWAG
ncbi:MAG: ERCC4 domain-containing protein [Verrucomicrobiota bacterium]